MPFHSLGDKDFLNMLNYSKYSKVVKTTKKLNASTSYNLFSHELPFYKCSDYAIMYECMTAYKKNTSCLWKQLFFRK